MKYSEFQKEKEQIIEIAKRIGALRAEVLDLNWPKVCWFVEMDDKEITFEAMIKRCSCCDDADFFKVPTHYLELSTDEEVQTALQNEKAEWDEQQRQLAKMRQEVAAAAQRDQEERERKRYEKLKAKYEPNANSAEIEQCTTDTQIEQLKNELRNLITSYDILVGKRSPFRGNEIALGVIRGAFLGVDEVRELITEELQG